jgi:hypothetical protein
MSLKFTHFFEIVSLLRATPSYIPMPNMLANSKIFFSMEEVRTQKDLICNSSFLRLFQHTNLELQEENLQEHPVGIKPVRSQDLQRQC